MPWQMLCRQDESVAQAGAGRILTPLPLDRGPSRSAAVYLVERLLNAPDHLDRATCCGRGYVFSVAQIFNLPYRRFVIGRTLLASGGWQVKNQLCSAEDLL